MTDTLFVLRNIIAFYPADYTEHINALDDRASSLIYGNKKAK